jgi:hypothetical protein
MSTAARVPRTPATNYNGLATIRVLPSLRHIEDSLSKKPSLLRLIIKKCSLAALVCAATYTLF